VVCDFTDFTGFTVFFIAINTRNGNRRDLVMQSEYTARNTGGGETSETGEIDSPINRVLFRFGGEAERLLAAEKLDPELFSERASIREFDGGVYREVAEVAAARDVIEVINRKVRP
jgi:hypothetical protein